MFDSLGVKVPCSTWWRCWTESFTANGETEGPAGAEQLMGRGLQAGKLPAGVYDE
jgi:hypothetical protein